MGGKLGGLHRNRRSIGAIANVVRGGLPLAAEKNPNYPFVIEVNNAGCAALALLKVYASENQPSGTLRATDAAANFFFGLLV